MAPPKKEMNRHKRAFECYFNLRKRSYARVAKKFGVHPSSVKMWAKAFDWHGRIEKRNVMAKKKTDEKATDRLSEMNTRHIKAAKLIQKSAEQHLMAAKQGSLRDSVMALKEGILLERLARGEATDIKESKDQVTLDDLRKVFSERERGLREDPGAKELKKEREKEKEKENKDKKEGDSESEAGCEKETSPQEIEILGTPA
jgi:hypothetical protein